MSDLNFEPDTASESNPSAQDDLHTKALTALQQEIEYHRLHDAQASILTKAVSSITGADADHSEQLLGDLLDQEKETPGTVSKEQVINAIKQDQSALRHQEYLGQYVQWTDNLVLSRLGRPGQVLSGVLTAAFSTSADAPLETKLIQAAKGFGLGFLGARVTGGMPGLSGWAANSIVSGSEAILLSPNLQLEIPDPDAIYAAPTLKAPEPIDLTVPGPDFINQNPWDTPEAKNLLTP